MNKRLPFIAILIAFIAGLAITSAPAMAATAPAGQALEIAPPVITLTVNPGQTTKVQIFLRNISSSDLIVSNQINDFVAGGQDGTPKLLLEDKSNNPYTLKTWVGALPNLTLVPKEIKSLTATITVPANAAPGGHYGVIRFTGTPAGLSGTGVSLSASLGALMLVTVNGNVSEGLSVQEFSVNHGGKSGSLFESLPLQFVEKFKNTGNVHVKPTGHVTITNMFGKKVAAVNVNLPPGNVLPQSVRKFDQPLDKTVLGNKKLFGRYNAKLNVTYGTNAKVLTASLTFWVIPFRLIAVVALILVVGFFAVRWLIKRYNQRIIDKAQNSQRK
jgi:hypothetical protein